MSQQERKNKTIAAFTTLGVNALLLLILIFVAAWGNAGSGQGEYPGIEVNLGYDEQGSGDIEPETPIGSEEAKDDENPPAKVIEQPEEKSVESTPPVEEENTKIIQSTTVTDPNSDVEIKEEKKEVKPVEKPIEKKIEKVEKPVEKKTEQPKVEPKPIAVYKGKTTSNAPSDENGTGKQGTAGNQGDDVGKEGNKGVPGGTVGAAVYKGTPGGGDGGSIELNGWDWDYIPKVDAPDNELPGRIVYLIEVDENGELIRYRKESSSVSAATEKACVEALSKLTFTKKPGAKVPEISKGKITFVVRAK
jgi:protein TonB